MSVIDAEMEIGRWETRGLIRVWEPLDHGTTWGFQSHLELGEHPCRECVTAEKTRLDVRAPDGRQLAPHGTHAAYNRHKANNSQPCELCRVAEASFNRLRKRAKRDVLAQEKPAPIPRTPAPHGTHAAWRAHYRRGESACTACGEAHNKYQRERRAARKEAA